MTAVPHTITHAMNAQWCYTSFFASKKLRRCRICQKPTMTKRRVWAIAHQRTRWLVLSLVVRNRPSRHCNKDRYMCKTSTATQLAYGCNVICLIVCKMSSDFDKQKWCRIRKKTIMASHFCAGTGKHCKTGYGICGGVSEDTIIIHLVVQHHDKEQKFCSS